MKKKPKHCHVPETCPVCRADKFLTRHHVYPKRHYGRENNRTIFRLCRECHNALEERIPEHKIRDNQYVQILLNFIEECAA